ncbi:MAG: hypothetical protein QUS11_04120 [Candidatus Fermentibacter sp.]|nr:hypothetical protein [Candidatus Fermentibacter sp.]
MDPVPVTRDPWDPDELKVWADGGVPIRRTIRFRVAVREACVIRSVIVAEDCASDWFIVQLPRGFQAPGSVMTVDVVRCRTAHPPYFRCVLVGNLVSRSELDVWHASLAKAE